MKTLNLAPQNSPKYAIFRSQNKKFAPFQTPLRWEGGVPGGPHLLRRYVPPNFELALTPLFWPRENVCNAGFGLGLVLGLGDLSSASRICPHLTSLSSENVRLRRNAMH